MCSNCSVQTLKPITTVGGINLIEKFKELLLRI